MSATAAPQSRRALLELAQPLRARVRFAELAELPTPVIALDSLARAAGGRAPLYEKRDDCTSPIYGGNKVRTLEVLFGDALARGVSNVYATGAYGSNHAAATAMHAPRVGLESGAVLYPQPPSRSARENLALLLSRQPRPALCDLPHWSALPFGMWLESRRAAARGERAEMMMPGGAVPLGALGYVSAGVELAEQVAAGALERPAIVVVATGSNCTTAGLLAGFVIAANRGIGFCDRGKPAPPLLVGVRVTPWPVSSRTRILSLARRTSLRLAEWAGDARLACTRGELAHALAIDGDQIGGGYGVGTERGREAVRLWNDHAGHSLETTYSAKAAAAVIARLRDAEKPILYWATKSSARLPVVADSELAWAPRRMQRWLAAAANCAPES